MCFVCEWVSERGHPDLQFIPKIKSNKVSVNTQNPALSPQSVLIMPNFGQKRHNI
jgi:hypothetical protein